MPDIADDRANVREAMRRAEEAAGIFRDESGNEVYGDPSATPVATPELEGAVPVSASDQPLATETVEETDTSEQQQEEQVETEEVTPEARIAELEAALAEREARIADQDKMIGRQSTDVGELRSELDALRAQVNAAPQVQPTPAPQMVITQDMIDNNPAQATALAFQQVTKAAEANGGQVDPASQHLLNAAFTAWEAEDEVAAARWRYDRLLEKQEADFRKELAAVRSEVAQVKAPLAANEEKTAWSEAFLEMQKAYPDFLHVDEATGKTNAQRLLEEVAPQFPATASLIAQGDVAAKVEGLTLLYEKGKLGNPAQVAEELKSAAEEAAAEAAATRAAAAAVNGQPNAGQGSTVELTEEEAEVERYKARIGGGVSLRRGWTGRT